MLLERGDAVDVCVKFRKLSFFKFTKRCIALILSVVIGVVAIIATDDDSFLLLLNSAKISIGESLGVTSGLDSDILSAEKDGNASRTIISRQGELNLSLISRINDNTPKKGYIKELLSLCRDAQNGKLNTNSNPGELPVDLILGLHIQEIGTNSDGVSPNYYFDMKDWKEDSANYSFKGFTSKSARSRGINESGGIGALQTSGASLSFKSSLSPRNNSRGASPGDSRFYPDALSYLGESYKKCLKYYGKRSKEAAYIATALTNNRGGKYRKAGGSGYEQCLTGMAYSISGGLSSATASHLDRVPDKIQSELTNALAAAYNTAEKKASVISLNKDDGYCAAVAAIMNSEDADQWFINSTAEAFLLRRNFVGLYQKMYKSQKLSAGAIKRKLHSHVSPSLASSINSVNGTRINGDVTKKVYNTGGDYQDCQYYSRTSVSNWGYVWYVSKITDSFGYYSKASGYGSPYFVSAYDGITFSYSYTSSGVYGRKVYAEMLRKAGVNEVDPTNPETYINQMTVVTTVSDDSGTSTSRRSSQTWTGELNSAYKGIKMKTTMLSNDRKTVLNTAARIATSSEYHYVYGGSHSSSITRSTGDYCSRQIYGMDCSSFVCWVYRLAGFSDVQILTVAGLWDSPQWKDVDLKDALPGDIILRKGGAGNHVEIYLGGTSYSRISKVGAHSHKSYNCKDSISIVPPRAWTGGYYKIRRLRDIDKGKKGKVKRIPGF